MVAQASVETLALSLPERLRIARRVALWHIGWSEDLRSLCHLCLLAHSLRGHLSRVPIYSQESTCDKATVVLGPLLLLPVESVSYLGYHVHVCPNSGNSRSLLVEYGQQGILTRQQSGRQPGQKRELNLGVGMQGPRVAIVGVWLESN